MRAISSAATSSSPRSSPSFSFGVAASRSPASAGSPLSVSKPNSDSASSRRRRAWGSNDPSARRRSVTPEPRANVAPPAPTSTLQNPPTAITAATRARLESREKAAEARAEARDKARRMTVSGGGHGGASRMDPDGKGRRLGRSSDGKGRRLRRGRPGSNRRPNGRPRRRLARSTSWRRPRGVLSRDSPRRRAPPTPSSTTAARCSPSSSRAGSTSTNSSPRGRHPPNPRRGGIEPARARTTKPRASVSNGRERHRPSLRPPSRLVFSRRGSWRRTRGTPRARLRVDRRRRRRRPTRRPPPPPRDVSSRTTIGSVSLTIQIPSLRAGGTRTVSASIRPATEPDSIATAVPETDQDRFEPDRSPLDVDRSNVISTSTPSPDVDDDFERFYARYAFEANMAARAPVAPRRSSSRWTRLKRPRNLNRHHPYRSSRARRRDRLLGRRHARRRRRDARRRRRRFRASPGKTVAAVRAARREGGGPPRARRRRRRGKEHPRSRNSTKTEEARAGRGVVPRRSRPPARVSRVANARGTVPGSPGKRTFRPGRRGARGRAIERHGVGGKAAGARARNAARAARFRWCTRNGAEYGGERVERRGAIETVEVKHEMSSARIRASPRSPSEFREIPLESKISSPNSSSKLRSPSRHVDERDVVSHLLAPARWRPPPSPSRFPRHPPSLARARSARRAACASRAVR